ncbi:hypothetical protein SDC9_88191 [bioreactor metagenome]|uniref:Uncharacterized protein n=1 Tax=bioreactor metagenome TaxID=1076179 RepID=A0A644ZL74_9ZZZZ
MPGELSVVWVVVVEVRVQEIDGERVARGPDDLVLPYPDVNFPVLESQGDLVRKEGKLLDRLPLHRFFRLPAVCVEGLLEVSLPVEQCQPHHGHAEIRSAFQDVPGKDAEAA